MPDAPPPQPDSKRLFDLLLGLNMKPGSAYTFVQEVGNMAAANLIARFESKLDAQGSRFESKLDAQGERFESKLDAQGERFESKLDAQGGRFESKLDAQNSKLEAQNTKIDAQTAQFTSLRWMVGLGFTLLAMLITLLRFLG
ncbi:MAG: hypothetical protein OXN89_05650 [Bryobacterales bacterium]|nr:hypothetical protein [Bryobacterales bacterium]